MSKMTRNIYEHQAGSNLDHFQGTEELGSSETKELQTRDVSKSRKRPALVDTNFPIQKRNTQQIQSDGTARGPS